MKLNVNPNRMELLRLKRRLELAQRGHKLLKDKQEDLISRVMDIKEEVKDLKKKLGDVFQRIYRDMAVSKAYMGSNLWQAVISGIDLNLNIEMQKVPVMNLRLTEYEYNIEGDPFEYSYAKTPGSFDDAVADLNSTVTLMLEMAKKQKWIFLISKELEKTRRRVNALEHILIPNLEDTIKFINMKLSELERANIVRMLKMKDFVK